MSITSPSFCLLTLGSKTLAYEVAEQLGWQVPDQLIVPVGSGAMLNAICKGFEELQSVSLLNDVSGIHIHCAQPHGCAPIVDAFKKGSNEVIPVENPDTVAKSLAIGDPGDGRYVLRRLKQYNSYAEESNNKEILDAILLLAKTEGIFTEPAGGVSVAVLKKLVEDGKIDKKPLKPISMSEMTWKVKRPQDSSLDWIKGKFNPK